MLNIEDIIGESTFIIAEAGVNHNGNIKLAKELIDVAAEAGADAVKFQTFNADKLVTKDAPKANYQNETTDKNESQYDMLKNLELSKVDHEKLIKYCKKKNIKFMSTPFSFDTVDLLEDVDLDLYKIGSSDTNNLPLLKYVAKKNKPIILSTGMSTLTEVSEAVDTILNKGNDKIILLHCVSNYPAEYENVNLKAMETMCKAFDLEVGYSDHTLGIEVPIAAVAMGAKVIEKHFTLDKTMEGPDHKASLNPKELEDMVNSIRNIEKALSHPKKQPTINEVENKKTVRKSLVINKKKTRGDTVYNTDIEIKRPGTGIAPKYLDIITGMKLMKDINKDMVLKWDDFKDE